VLFRCAASATRFEAPFTGWLVVEGQPNRLGLRLGLCPYIDVIIAATRDGTSFYRNAADPFAELRSTGGNFTLAVEAADVDEDPTMDDQLDDNNATHVASLAIPEGGSPDVFEWALLAPTDVVGPNLTAVFAGMYNATAQKIPGLTVELAAAKQYYAHAIRPALDADDDNDDLRRNVSRQELDNVVRVYAPGNVTFGCIIDAPTRTSACVVPVPAAARRVTVSVMQSDFVDNTVTATLNASSDLATELPVRSRSSWPPVRPGGARGTSPARSAFCTPTSSWATSASATTV
jgi:hypothetical protein